MSTTSSMVNWRDRRFTTCAAKARWDLAELQQHQAGLCRHGQVRESPHGWRLIKTDKVTDTGSDGSLRTVAGSYP